MNRTIAIAALLALALIALVAAPLHALGLLRERGQ